MNKLSLHFTVEQFIRSQTAARLGINNTPADEHIVNMALLCYHVLQPLRESLEMPVWISSGYRCPALNKAIGGSKNSQHMLGQAADIVVSGVKPFTIAEAIHNLGLPVDQVIVEFGRWTHVSYSRKDRMEFLQTIDGGYAPLKFKKGGIA